jgi:hypothetical protein
MRFFETRHSANPSLLRTVTLSAAVNYRAVSFSAVCKSLKYALACV